MIAKDKGKLLEYECNTPHSFSPGCSRKCFRIWIYAVAQVDWRFVDEIVADFMDGKISHYNATNGATSKNKSNMNDDVQYINIYSDIISRSFIGD